MKNNNRVSEEFLSIRKRFLELEQFKREELNGMALRFGIDTRPYLNTMWRGMGSRKENYENLTKADVIFTIIAEEIRRGERAR